MAKSPTNPLLAQIKSQTLREIVDGVLSINDRMIEEGAYPPNFRLHFSPKSFTALSKECRKEVGFAIKKINGVPWFLGFPVVLDMMNRDDDSISCCLMADGGNYYG